MKLHKCHLTVWYAPWNAVLEALNSAREWPRIQYRWALTHCVFGPIFLWLKKYTHPFVLDKNKFHGWLSRGWRNPIWSEPFFVSNAKVEIHSHYLLINGLPWMRVSEFVSKMQHQSNKFAKAESLRPKSRLSNFIFVTWNQPQWEYLHQRNQQTLQIRWVFLLPTPESLPTHHWKRLCFLLNK